MKPAEIMLWQKIDRFQLDDPMVAFKFSDRLAHENGWTAQYSLRVIEEYKKFIFMCCVAEQGVTPSDPVDQAWHLHLTFTKSYWIDLCRNTLGKDIHHNPTKGGEKEADKFDGLYTLSQKLYKDKFGTIVPADIWQNNNERFSDVNFQRVNLGRNWIITKPRLSVAALTLLMLLIACTTFIQASVEDYGAPVLMASIVIVIAIGIYKWESNPGRRKGNNDNSGNGCSTAGCGGDFGSSHHGGHDSHDGGHGGDSGHSGCSSSGCSGCGSGGD